MARARHWVAHALMGALVAAGAAPGGGAAVPAAPEGTLVTRHVENGAFPTSLRAWRLRSSPTNTAASWAPDGMPVSPGSAWVSATTTGTAAAEALLFQCLPHALPSSSYDLAASWYAPGGQPLEPGGGGVSLRIVQFDDELCATTTTEAVGPPDLTFGGPGNGGWQAFTRSVTTRPTTYSIGVELRHIRLNAQPAGTSGVFFDEVSVEGSFGFVKGDFDGGAETDLLLRNTVTNKHVAWLLNDETLALESTVSPPPAVPWQAVGVDDWNDDGRNDLLMWHPVNGWLDFWFMEGTARTGPAVPISVDPGPDWKPSATADFDRDGSPDILLRNTVTQALEVWIMDGVNRLGVTVPTPDRAVDSNWEVVGAGDLNGDRRIDLLWYNATSGRIVYWLLNDNLVRTTGAFTNPMAAGDANWKVLAMGDYGHGPAPAGGIALTGTIDLVWRNATSGRMVVWFMDRSGNRTSGLFVQPPTPPDPPTDWTIAGPR